MIAKDGSANPLIESDTCFALDASPMTVAEATSNMDVSLTSFGDGVLEPLLQQNIISRARNEFFMDILTGSDDAGNKVADDKVFPMVEALTQSNRSVDSIVPSYGYTNQIEYGQAYHGYCPASAFQYVCADQPIVSDELPDSPASVNNCDAEAPGVAVIPDRVTAKRRLSLRSVPACTTPILCRQRKMSRDDVDGSAIQRSTDDTEPLISLRRPERTSSLPLDLSSLPPDFLSQMKTTARNVALSEPAYRRLPEKSQHTIT